MQPIPLSSAALLGNPNVAPSSNRSAFNRNGNLEPLLGVRQVNQPRRIFTGSVTILAITCSAMSIVTALIIAHEKVQQKAVDNGFMTYENGCYVCQNYSSN